MSYVKISDPAIIDLAGIQQIISVVNQHSDYLNVLINKLGVINNPDWSADDLSAINDLASTTIAYGKIKVKDIEANRYTTSGGKRFYAVSNIPFGTGVSFSQPPRIVATIDNIGHALNNRLDFIPSVHGVTTTSFTMRIMRAGSESNLQLTDDVSVNWIAIGPR